MVSTLSVAESLLPEFDREMTTTRKLLERVPDDQLGWKPHEKSMTLAELATHVANLPRWGELTLNESEIDLAGMDKAAPATSRAAVLDLFDARVRTTRKILTEKQDAELLAMWTLKREGRPMFSMPKTTVWRTFFMNHLVHHRGQLSVYLRLQNVPIPSMYGPSADEGSL